MAIYLECWVESAHASFCSYYILGSIFEDLF